MDARPPVLDRSGTDATDVAAGSYRPIKFAGAIVVLLLLLLLVAHSPQIDSNAAVTTAPQNDRSADATFRIDYFPAQFRSPSGTPEEHIQAF
jgi:hypothetical protein